MHQIQISRTKAEVIALTDASATVPTDAILKSAAHFMNKNVGVVVGIDR